MRETLKWTLGSSFYLRWVAAVMFLSLVSHVPCVLLAVRVGVRVRRASRKVATEGASLSFVLPSTASPPASPLPYSPYPQDKPHAPPAFNGGGQRGQEQDYEDDEEDFDSDEE